MACSIRQCLPSSRAQFIRSWLQRKETLGLPFIYTSSVMVIVDSCLLECTFEKCYRGLYNPDYSLKISATKQHGVRSFVNSSYHGMPFHCCIGNERKGKSELFSAPSSCFLQVLFLLLFLLLLHFLVFLLWCAISNGIKKVLEAVKTPTKSWVLISWDSSSSDWSRQNCMGWSGSREKRRRYWLTGWLVGRW